MRTIYRAKVALFYASQVVRHFLRVQGDEHKDPFSLLRRLMRDCGEISLHTVHSVAFAL
jgi:hypothetical protein